MPSRQPAGRRRYGRFQRKEVHFPKSILGEASVQSAHANEGDHRGWGKILKRRVRRERPQRAQRDTMLATRFAGSD
jgi:hypothetical protein